MAKYGRAKLICSSSEALLFLFRFYWFHCGTHVHCAHGHDWKDCESIHWWNLPIQRGRTEAFEVSVKPRRLRVRLACPWGQSCSFSRDGGGTTWWCLPPSYKWDAGFFPFLEGGEVVSSMLSKMGWKAATQASRHPLQPPACPVLLGGTFAHGSPLTALWPLCPGSPGSCVPKRKYCSSEVSQEVRLTFISRFRKRMK